MKSSALTDDGIEIVYDDLGEGSTAILLMPGWCSNRFQFSAPLSPLLATEYRTLTLDWRGHGDSAVPETDFGYRDLTRDALAVIEASGVETVYAVAAAHGAWTALELRRLMGPKVIGTCALSWMILGTPPPFAGALEKLQGESSWSEVRDQLFAMWRNGSDNEGVVAQLADMATYPAEMWRRAGREIAAAFEAETSPIEAFGSLDRTMPFLHLYAQPTAPELLQAQEEASAQHDWFEVKRIEAETHFPQFERPQEVADLILDHVRRCLASASS